MKKNLFFLATAFAAVIMMLSATTANASDSVDDVRSFDKTFNGIILNGNATVYVLQSPTRSVNVTGNKSLVSEVTITIEDNNLVIDAGPVRNTNIYVTLPEITLLQVNGNGLIRTMTSVYGDIMQLKITGDGTIAARVQTSTLGLTVNGNGKIYIGGIADETYTRLKGRGSVISLDAAILDAITSSNSVRMMTTGLQ